ncbi:hypothetical protein UlMin_012740 [Ulmus minor]
MASKAVVVQPRGEGGKLKNVPVEGRNRRVLQDIGNLVTTRAAEGKQLKPNAQVAIEKNKKPAKEVDGITKLEAADKIASEKLEADLAGIVIRSDKDEKSTPLGGRKLREGTARKNFKTFTSTLSARSKAACGLTSRPKGPIVNIDAADSENELAVVEYIDELYEFYKLSEEETRIQNYMELQPDLNAKMRSILVDWLTEVHNKFELMPETLYLTINLVDRYLSVKVVPRKELQLVGISSMLLASKYEEIWAPEVNDFVCISDSAYKKEQILAMEKAILGKLGWYLTVPTPYVFLARYIKASVPFDEELENMAFFLAELGLIHYSAATSYCPSIMAAAAVYAARYTLDKNPFWTETLEHHTGYSEDQLMDCANLLVGFHSAAAESKLRAVYKKFSNIERGAVALHSPAKSLSVNSP